MTKTPDTAVNEASNKASNKASSKASSKASNRRAKALSTRASAAVLAAGLMAFGAAQAHGDKHEHGVVHLDVAIEGDTLAIQLESPLDSVLGFERQPRTPAERQSVERMLATLRGGAVLFTPDARGQCRFEGAQLESALIASPSADNPPPRSEHLDVDVSYRFRCAATAELTTLSHQLFALFPRIQRIDAQVATPKGQSRQVLKRPAATLSLGG
ncbi:DUF2796 domain-containing protein [Roseateles noduli]|uniref:DUF2796 domain-containing protein n=1 Tax=Roseateles noduli TaxID=2052484 RepID=UPI003D65E408